jgi:cytochrome c
MFAGGSAAADELNLGRDLTAAELAGWDINVFPDGKGLPPGKGTVADGERVYQNACAACHGMKLEGGLGPALTGGKGSLTTMKPLKTVGSYWPYSTTLFDYIRRAMPFQAPQSLSNEDVYSVSGYILYVNGLMKADDIVDAKSLQAVQMPNRNAFYVDNRPDAKSKRCMKDCIRDSPPKAASH